MASKAVDLRPVSSWRIAAAALAAVLLATSWMLLSLVAGKVGLGKALTAQSSGQAALVQSITRTALTEHGTKIQVMFAIPEYYQRTGQAEAAAEVDPEKYLVFIVTENNHNALAPMPMPTLMANGKPLTVPVKDRVLSTSDHHRTRLIRYPRLAPNGESYIPKNLRSLELAWPGVKTEHRADHTVGTPLTWDWPLELPSESGGALTPMAFLLLTFGLFAALSPCLVQLTLYYLSALAGTSTGGEAPGTNRRKIMQVASMFVAGITVAYVLGGVLAGYLGQTIQVSNVLGAYGRWLAIGSGMVIVVMGFQTVLSSNAPMVCRMPPGFARFGGKGGGPVSSFFMGFLMSLGCLQCFGGAIFASLLLYVGSLGSPGLGALMLLLFSLGIAVPFLAAAFAWEKISRWLSSLERVMQNVAMVSGVMMMSFGILMVVDRFHWISGVLLQWLPFLRA